MFIIQISLYAAFVPFCGNVVYNRHKNGIHIYLCNYITSKLMITRVNIMKEQNQSVIAEAKGRKVIIARKSAVLLLFEGVYSWCNRFVAGK